MLSVTILLSVGTLVFIVAPANAGDEFSPEGQVCYDTIISEFEPVQQMVNKCQEKVNQKEENENGEWVMRGCLLISRDNELAPTIEKLVLACGKYEKTASSDELDELVKRVADYYLEKGLDLKTILN